MYCAEGVTTVHLTETWWRFALVGALTAVLYYGLLLLAVEWLLLPATLASSVAYVIVVAFNYRMHYSWTFGQHETPHGRTLLRYLVMISCGFLANAALMYAGTQWLSVHYLLTQTVALLVVVLWNFVISNAWVFRH